MAKDKNRVSPVKGLRRAGTVLDCGRPSQILPSDSGDPAPYTGSGSRGQDLLRKALTAMEHRTHGLLQDRVRIGRDLHDSILQSLYAIGLNLEAAWNIDMLHPQSSRWLHDRVIAQLNHLAQEVRAMIASLDSGTIQDFDLTAELMSLQAVYEQAGRLRVDVDLHAAIMDVLTTKERGEILNIVREALSNCVRHANAARVTVALRLDGLTVWISIIDDGKGFALTDHHRRGYGLANMEARARKLGGKLHVRSAIGNGTAIAVEFTLALIPVDL
ncbi:MAG: histidine kinase [Nitrospira sp.]|nr:histidine kinase [Nitrospira sp.]